MYLWRAKCSSKNKIKLIRFLYGLTKILKRSSKELSQKMYTKTKYVVRFWQDVGWVCPKFYLQLAHKNRIKFSINSIHMQILYLIVSR